MYKVRNENKRLPVKINSNLKLYDACLKIVNIDSGIVLQGGKLIAFWCSFDKRVKAGFGANPYEKEQIKNFHNDGPSPIRSYNRFTGVK